MYGLRERKFAYEISRSVMESNVIEDFDSASITACYDKNRNYVNRLGVPFESKFEFIPNTTIRFLGKHIMDKCRNGKTIVVHSGEYTSPGPEVIKDNHLFTSSEQFNRYSTIVNVLSRFKSYYDYNKDNIRNGLYENRCIYSPGIVATLDEFDSVYFCNVLTCTPPNVRAAIENGISVTEAENAFNNRIYFLLNVAVEKGADNLILDDWGCDHWNPSHIAEAFSSIMNTSYYNSFKKIIFCINNNENLNTFKRIILPHEKHLHE